MVSEDHDSILQLRKCTILELHKQAIFTPPVKDIVCENYYAVEFKTKFYIGRAIRVIRDKVELKFFQPMVKKIQVASEE